MTAFFVISADIGLQERVLGSRLKLGSRIMPANNIVPNSSIRRFLPTYPMGRVVVPKWPYMP